MGYREVFLLSTGLAVLASAGFLANLQLDTNSSTRDYKTITELVPLVLVIVRFLKKKIFPFESDLNLSVI